MSCGRMLFAEVESVLESRSLNSRSPGRLPKWPTGADGKSAGLRLRWFESITYHHPFFDPMIVFVRVLGNSPRVTTIALHLWKQSPYPFGFLHAFDAEAEGGQAHGEFLFAGERDDLGIGGFEDAEKFVGHFGFAPEEALQVLHPLEVAD